MLFFCGIKDPADESHRDRDIIYFLPDGIKPGGKIEIEYTSKTSFIVPVESHKDGKKVLVFKLTASFSRYCD